MCGAARLCAKTAAHALATSRRAQAMSPRQAPATPGWVLRSELVARRPADFVVSPQGFLPLVSDPAVRQWALEVHALWNHLHRVVRRPSSLGRARPSTST